MTNPPPLDNPEHDPGYRRQVPTRFIQKRDQRPPRPPIEPSDLRPDYGPEHATLPAPRVTGPEAERPTPVPDPSGGRVWDGTPPTLWGVIRAGIQGQGTARTDHVNIGPGWQSTYDGMVRNWDRLINPVLVRAGINDPSVSAGWRCDQCDTWWPHYVVPIQDPTDVAWRGQDSRRFCNPDCLTAYTESLGTQP